MLPVAPQIVSEQPNYVPISPTRLQRRLQQIDKLGGKEKRQILQFLDTFLEREKLKQRVGATS